MQPITFPGLGLTFQIDRVAFSIGGFGVYWYGLIIGIGFFLAVFLGLHEAKRIRVNTDDLIDAILWTTPVAIIGARLYYVIMEWDYYGAHPSEIIAIRDGGLAIYGAVIAACLMALLFSRLKKIPIGKLLDLVAIGFMPAQAIGRWGNFVNQEAFGSVTELPWRMGLVVGGETVYVHPTFLYESLWNLVGFAVIYTLFRLAHRELSEGKERGRFLTFYARPGVTFLSYVFWYGMGRLWIEGLRTDSLYLFGVRISQWLAGVSMVVALVLLIWLAVRKPKAEETEEEIKEEASEEVLEEKEE